MIKNSVQLSRRQNKIRLAAIKFKILITSGASCPDALVEGVIEKLATYFTIKNSIEDLAKTFQ